jgi:uncharacterized protein YjbI with pentapeptide repeats
MQYNKEELKLILDNHALWLRDEHEGNKADLSEADLIGANLTGANLREADLIGVKGINN